MPRIDEIAFDSERKRMTTLHETLDGRISFTKGSPDEILERCRYCVEQRQDGGVFCGGESGNPAWFSKPYFSELKELSGDRGGKKVLKRHWESVIPFRVEAAWELKDLDRKEDL